MKKYKVCVYAICKNEEKLYTDNITLNHYPDNSKSRSNYLPLLELSIKETPLDDRNMHYLCREYMYYEMWNEAIDMNTDKNNQERLFKNKNIIQEKKFSVNFTEIFLYNLKPTL